MSVIAWLRSRPVEAAWFLFAAANVAAMVAWPSWETIPFHFVWISLTLVYGFRVWRPAATSLVLGLVVVSSGASILADAFAGVQLWGELFEVPLMAAMFLAMVWHARRRQAAVREAEALVRQQERFLHDVSHELRTPVTIARGHLELLRLDEQDSAEVAVALDELGRIDRIIARLLLLAKAGQPGFLTVSAIDVELFLEDVFMRWSEVAPRAWRLGPVIRGTLRADEEALRGALDALLENAVKYTEPHEAIDLRARVLDYGLVLEVADGGSGVPAEALDRIFDRFARADDARTRTNGGVGLGLSIVDAVAKAHGGACTVTPRTQGTVFSIFLPDFEPAGAAADLPAAYLPALQPVD
jgi:two-component system OmpR family sensor kinase